MVALYVSIWTDLAGVPECSTLWWKIELVRQLAVSGIDSMCVSALSALKMAE